MSFEDMPLLTNFFNFLCFEQAPCFRTFWYLSLCAWDLFRCFRGKDVLGFIFRSKTISREPLSCIPWDPAGVCAVLGSCDVEGEKFSELDEISGRLLCDGPEQLLPGEELCVELHPLEDKHPIVGFSRL